MLLYILLLLIVLLTPILLLNALFFSHDEQHVTLLSNPRFSVVLPRADCYCDGKSSGYLIPLCLKIGASVSGELVFLGLKSMSQLVVLYSRISIGVCVELVVITCYSRTRINRVRLPILLMIS